MEFFGEAINTLSILVIALGAGLAVWGVINLLEGYGNDNPGANGQCPKRSKQAHCGRRRNCAITRWCRCFRSPNY